MNETIVAYHLDQIDTILRDQRHLQSFVWTTSLLSGMTAMEFGIRARVFPRSVAKAVLRKAVAARHDEHGPTNRWFIACLMESLATLRVLDRQGAYAQAKREVLTRLPPPS